MDYFVHERLILVRDSSTGMSEKNPVTDSTGGSFFCSWKFLLLNDVLESRYQEKYLFKATTPPPFKNHQANLLYLAGSKSLSKKAQLRTSILKEWGRWFALFRGRLKNGDNKHRPISQDSSGVLGRT